MFNKIASILSGLLFSLAMILMYQAFHANELPKRIAVRSSYNQIVLRLQQVATARSGYVECKANQACGIKIDIFENAVRQFKVVEPVAFRFDPSTTQIKGSLHYTGEDLRIPPREIAIQLPFDVLSAARSLCPITEPLLIGLDGAGRAICRPIGKMMCAEGEYVTGLDPVSLSVSCAPVGAAIQCAEGEVITSFEWRGGDRIATSCTPRLNPFIAWKFSPMLKIGSAITDEVQR